MELSWANYGLIWAAFITMGCLEVLFTYVLEFLNVDFEHVFTPPLDDTITKLLIRALFIPLYLVFLWIGLHFLPFFLIHEAYKFVAKLESVGTFFRKVRAFFNKKPLQFLKQYKVTISRREE